jgi:hypothetical protein
VKAKYLKANPKATEAIVEGQELRKEEAEVKTIGALEYVYGSMHLAVRRRQLPSEDG